MTKILLPYSLHHQIPNLQAQIGALFEQLSNQTSDSKALFKFSDQVLRIAVSLDKLADSLSGYYSNAAAADDGNEMSNVEQDFSEPEEQELKEGSSLSAKRVFNSAELRNYTSPKPNRLSGKKNFFGLKAVNPSIGPTCTAMSVNLDRYMNYKIYGMCPEDWDLAQKLIVGGCDPFTKKKVLLKNTSKLQ